MTEHKLVDGTLKREAGGIAARCECGWVSSHFTSLAASAAMVEHQEECERRKYAEGSALTEAERRRY